MEVYLACENSSGDPIDTYVVTASAMLVIVKLTLLRLQRSTLSTNLFSAIQDWCSVEDAKSRDIMIQHARMARIISLSLFYSGFFAFMLYMLRLLPVVTANERTFYLPTSCLFESVTSLQYVLITFYQVVQLFIAYAGNCCTEGIFVGITLHLCGQLELLMIDFQQISRRRHKQKKGSLVEEFVVRHRRLLRLTETIEDTYNIIILTQIFTSAILICITGLQLIVSLAIHDFFLVWRSIMSFNILMIQLFLYSYMGETLSSKTQAISQAAYLSEWYDLPTNIMRDLYFIIARANVPVRIRAGKFYNIDLNSFKNVLKASVSYFSVLQIMLI
ncbi:Odorant receptor 2a [Camponotus floridanus]|uniref:Odorant receptor 2a n=1 Tax=Camponotus floridanus TaxID=104421 RepID=E2AS34_CAMFO|nr:Odorant receptor 2a [Camponotus floridanus]